ncbi:hypothetical protein VE01_04078 [Pseudogymnoascus verrucosus]|uniref:Uncharacterized protein n=1 Tax=Pseudogymnoascus verrucosus TaxID=342668 RepID=A0A1B8GLK0_9PEZI|nr:uncharacterized protein VE01_04078 [Pseudogymnoascus verrucosus]OBT96714.1 hypothetical protein VE01_04078 [Pseudogymnoascus verrucosus]
MGFAQITIALTKIEDMVGDTTKQKLIDELARAKATIDQQKIDLTTAATLREELIAKHGEAIGEMRATARLHEEENVALKAQITELLRQLADPREQPPPPSRRGALTFAESIPRRPHVIPSPGDPTPLPVGTPHILPPQRDTLMTPSETPSARRRGSALEEWNRKKRRALSTSDVSSERVEWAVSTSDDEDEDTSRHPPFSAVLLHVPRPRAISFRWWRCAWLRASTVRPNRRDERDARFRLIRASDFRWRRDFSRIPGSALTIPLRVARIPWLTEPASLAGPGSASSSSRGPGQIFSGFAPVPVLSGSAEDRTAPPGRRPASIAPGLSGSRGPFVGAPTVSLFPSDLAGRGVFSGAMPAPVLPGPTMGRGVFSGPAPAYLLPGPSQGRGMMPPPAPGIQIPSAGGFASAPVPVSGLAQSPSSVPSGTITVVSVVAIDHVAAKISEWWARAEANRPGSGRVWHQPTSKRILCVELKSRTSRVVVAQPASNYYGKDRRD